MLAKNKQKLVAGLVTLCMTASLLPVSALADEHEHRPELPTIEDVLGIIGVVDEDRDFILLECDAVKEHYVSAHFAADDEFTIDWDDDDDDVIVTYTPQDGDGLIADINTSTGVEHTYVDPKPFSFELEWDDNHWELEDEGPFILRVTCQEEEPEPTPPPEDDRTVVVAFNAYENGVLTGVENENAHSVTVDLSEDGTYDIPGVQPDEGYTFTGWKANDDAQTVWDAEASSFTAEDVADLAYFPEGSTEGYVTFTAQFEKTEPVEEKTLRIHWAVDNYEHAGFVPGGDTWTETIAWSDRENTFVLPEVHVDEGYHLAGWSVSGTQGNYWDASAETFGLTGLIVEDEQGGYVSITANVVKDGPVETGKVTVHFYISNENAASYANGAKNVDVEAVSENETVAFPKLTVNDGYRLTGWQINGEQSAVWDAAAYEIGLMGWPVYGEDGNGDVSITPIFEEDKDDPDPEPTPDPDPDPDPDPGRPGGGDDDDDDDDDDGGNTDVPDEPVPLGPGGGDTDVPDEPVPLGPGGGETDVPDEPIPQGPGAGTGETDIPEGEVPKGALPQTGMVARGVNPAVTLGLVAFAFSMAGAGLTVTFSRKKEDEE